MIEGLALVAGLALAALALKIVFSHRAAPATPSDNMLVGPLSAYFDKIEALDINANADFFVSAMVIGSDHFVQVSVGSPSPGTTMYQFDIPVTSWSEPYLEAIETEARRLGVTPIRVDGGPMQFLDIDFTSRKEHERFARWVVMEVFRIAQNAQFEITWGAH